MVSWFLLMIILLPKALLWFLPATPARIQKYEQRLIALDAKYTPMGFPVIAINPNDPSASNGDSYDEMKSYAKSKSFTFPYLYDEGQVITAAYGAKATPHIFLLSKSAKGQVIEYTGAVDSDTPGEDPNRTKYVEDAVDALLAQKKPALAITKAIGCRVKWKSM